MNYLFSIIVPCYNSFKNMNKCLISLEKQNYKNFEVIFVDDMSSDNTYEFLLNYQEKTTFRYKVLRSKENGGPGSARNLGLVESKGDYILFLDSDDYLDSRALEIINSHIKGNDCLIFDYFREHGESKYKCDTVYNKIAGSLSISDALKFSSSSVCCKCYSSKLLLSNKIFFPDLIRSEDLVFNKIALSKCKNIIYIKDALYYYTLNEGSIMNTLTNIILNNEIDAFQIMKEGIPLRYSSELNQIYSEEVVFTTIQNMVLLKYSKQDVVTMIRHLMKKNSDWIIDFNKQNYNLYHFLFLKCVISERVIFIYWLVFIKSIIKKKL